MPAKDAPAIDPAMKETTEMLHNAARHWVLVMDNKYRPEHGRGSLTEAEDLLHFAAMGYAKARLRWDNRK